MTRREYAEWAKNWWPNFLEREAKSKRKGQIQRIELEVSHFVRLMFTDTMFCVVCGNEFYYNGEDITIWCKQKRCEECKRLGKNNRNQKTKYCRRCGKRHTYETFLASYIASHPTGTPRKSWANWTNCPDCADFGKTLNELCAEETKKRIAEFNAIHPAED